MSVNLEQTEGVGGVTTPPPVPPPQPCKLNDASSATAVTAPSFNSSRRVTLRMALILDALYDIILAAWANSHEAAVPGAAADESASFAAVGYVFALTV